MEQLEFSLSRFVKYAFRYILVILLCVALGLGGGVLLAKNSSSSNYEKYTARMSFDITQYAVAVGGGNTVSEGDYYLHARQLAQVAEAACAPEVAAQTFRLLCGELYTNGNEDDKSEAFYKDLEVKPGIESFTVSFAYNVQNDADRAEAQKVVATYLDVATATVLAKYPELANEAYADVICKGDVVQDFHLSADQLAANAPQGFLGKMLLGAICGGALAAVIVFAGYFFDPRIKSVKELLPAEKSAVLMADREDAVLAFAARIKASKAKSILLAAPVATPAFEAFAERAQKYLAQSGADVKTVLVDTQNAAWLAQPDETAQTEGYVLCLCNGAGKEVISCLSGRVDATALFVDHKKVMAKCLKASADEVEQGVYLATLLHNVSKAYLD